MQTIGILLLGLSLLSSGATHSQDKLQLAGFPKSRIPDIKINAQIPYATALDLTRPSYSPDVHVAGTARIWVKIDKAGDVVAGRAISGHALLQPWALQAAIKSKFEPKSALGSRSITGTITYTFTFPDDNDVDLRTMVGRRVTLSGQFSMRGKIGPFLIVSGQPVYLVSSPPSTWPRKYSRMEGKRVRVTGTLRFYQAPPLPEHADSAEARLPDYFYFEAKHTIVRLNDQRPD